MGDDFSSRATAWASPLARRRDDDVFRILRVKNAQEIGCDLLGKLSTKKEEIVRPRDRQI